MTRNQSSTRRSLLNDFQHSYNRISVVLIFLFLSSLAQADTHQIRIIDHSENQAMSFKPLFLKVNPKEKVVFKPAYPGHATESVFLPKGAKSWKAKPMEEIEISLEVEGIYLYACQYHWNIGMVGIIQVGRPVNKLEARRFYEKYKKKLVLHKNRLDQFLK